MAKEQCMSLDDELQVLPLADRGNPLRQMLEDAAQRSLELEMAEYQGADR
jgi:23S rRNA C2498 (ribose-2'-O)-methylase RlmM